MNTEEMLDKMLKENTGRSLMDSGDLYGRHYETNKLRDFKKEPEVTLSFKHGYIDATVNLYHYLLHNVDYLEELDNEYLEFENNSDQYDSYLNTLDMFAESKGWEEINSDNTYNHNNFLDQNVQYTSYLTPDKMLVAGVQSHNGCDVRGGYPRPRICSVSDMLGVNPEISIHCDKCCSTWYSDDNSNWYCSMKIGHLTDRYYPKLNEMNILEADSKECEEYINKCTLIVISDSQLTLPEMEGVSRISVVNNNPKYKIPTDDDGNGICPICGHGILEPAVYYYD